MRVFGLAAWSGSGKTTLIAQLLPELIRRHYRVSTVKHAHHAFDVDQPGKDSYRHRAAGATETLIASAARWALLHELRAEAEPELDALVRHLSPVDFLIIEGFKRHPHPKLEIIRPSLGKPLLYPDDPSICGVAMVEPGPLVSCTLPIYAADDIGGIADLVVAMAAPLGLCPKPPGALAPGPPF